LPDVQRMKIDRQQLSAHNDYEGLSCQAREVPSAKMIPDFNEHGYLPEGIHRATLDEISDRFGHQSEVRRVQMESLRWLSEIVPKVGVERLLVNGSFATDTLEPNDVDCVLLIGPAFPLDQDSEAELLAGLPFLDISLVRKDAFELLVEIIFATDRHRVPKGMIEVIA